MKDLFFPAQHILSYVLTGKFQAPSPEWKHECFFLGEYELFVITEGILYLEYNHERFSVKEGEYLILPPCNAYRQGYKSSYCSFYWLHFSFPQEYVPTSQGNNLLTLNAPYGNYFSLPQKGIIPKPEKLVVLMKQLQDIVKNSYPLSSINTMTTCIIAELCGQISLYKPQNKPSNIKQIDYDIIDYIKQNINRTLTIKEIASHFGYNPKYLSYKFEKTHGITLKEFIVSQKIDMANSLLTDTNMSVSEISKNLGFSDSHNFSRLYKTCTGLTPSEYRNTFAKRMIYDH